MNFHACSDTTAAMNTVPSYSHTDFKGRLSNCKYLHKRIFLKEPG